MQLSAQMVLKKGYAAKCVVLGCWEDLQLSVQIRTVFFCKELNINRSSVDVAPTLVVNHIYLVLWWFCLLLFMLCFYAFDK